MTTYQYSFKKWVPRWLMLLAIFMTLIPVGALLGIYLGGMNSAMSYYNGDSNDIRFSVVLYYLAIASAFPFEKAIANKFTTKPYFAASCILYVLLNLILYNTQNLILLFVFRFLGGVLSLAFIGTLFALIFQQFHSQRSRILGYALLYGSLLGSIPLSYIIDAFIFSYYNFNVLFMLKIFICLPGFTLLFICLKNNVDLRVEKSHLKEKVDWRSFVLYASALITAAYTLCYGQYYNWFYSTHIIYATIFFVVTLLLFFFRQLKLKKPYIDLSIYKHRNFRIGMLMLIAFYFSKGDTSVSYGFFATGVHLDVYHKAYVMIVNGLGVFAGAALTARFLLVGTRIRLIWLTGFASLLFFHIYMIFIFGNQAETSDLWLPLFFQGFGNGTLMLSIVMFYATGVPAEIGFSASVTGVSYRFFSFTASMALIAFMSLKQGSTHYNDFAQEVVTTNPESTQHIKAYSQAFLNKGASQLQAKAGAKKLLGAEVRQQTNLLYARDYYIYMSTFIILVMLSIALIPHFQYHLRKIGDKLVPL
ncbi:Major Facilitator Superfamily protein [Pustulibacterium marinum]|uniref:Major Facilitator Superfamily protein n=1 Tax=Pustulibacterium marinum TaxID=1224947 RepID=A0A1I7HAW5_9FLAO|nr:MFS transporter [Pustulibacterium marinum]SFU57871.1 Major Facilitator Superfamily protein [Pustulibacterium marinum]